MNLVFPLVWEILTLFSFMPLRLVEICIRVFFMNLLEDEVFLQEHFCNASE